MNDDWLLMWLSAFVTTILVETPIYMLFLQARMHLGWGALVSLGLQMSTHPLLWIIWPHVQHALDYTPLVIIAEVCVVLVEGALLVLVMGTAYWRRALLASLVANATSTIVGLLH